VTVQDTIKSKLSAIATETKASKSAIAKIAFAELSDSEKQVMLFSRVWSQDGKSATYDIAGYTFTITQLSNGTYSCTPIECVTYFSDGKRNARASMKERAESAKGLPDSHDIALRNAITRINGSIRNVLDDRETNAEASARKSNAHAIKQAEAIANAQAEAKAKDAKIAELLQKLAEAEAKAKRAS